jgi:hypothetical protein
LKPEFADEKEVVECERASKLDAFVPVVRAWLVEDKSRFYKQRHTATRVYERLRAEFPNFTAKKRSVQILFKRLSEEVYGKGVAADLSIPIAGLSEVSVSPIEFTYQGAAHKGFALLLAFPHSNAAYMQLLLGLNTECILEAIKSVFTYLGGTPQRVKFSASTKLFKHFLNDISDIENELLLRFILFYGFKDDYFISSCDGNLTVVSGLSLGY